LVVERVRALPPDLVRPVVPLIPPVPLMVMSCAELLTVTEAGLTEVLSVTVAVPLSELSVN